jgi:hypothetical protein
VRSAACPPAPDRNRLAAKSQGNIGIGGSALNLGDIAQVIIDRANYLQYPRPGLQFTTRTIPNHYHFGT